MNVIVNNLGPIQQAKFDFDKKISIFCGPNNTGKTYLSYILYLFTRQRIIPLEDSMTSTQWRDFIVKKSFILPIDVEEIYELVVKRLDIMPQDLSAVFGISETIANKLFADFKIQIDVDKETYITYLKDRVIDSQLNHKGHSVARVTKKAGETILHIQNISSQLDENSESIREELFTQIYKLLIQPVFFSHFFPVERNSLYTYYKDILANRSQLMELLQRLDNGNRQALVDYISRNSARYPMAVSYTLDAANKMSAVSQDRGYYASLADEIEKVILGGKLSLTEDGDMKYASDKSPEKDIPLYLSASMTKSMSGLVHCLRHVAGRHDMIFIDEPEINCHPDAQIMMTRIFGKMVRAGLRLIISTHSDYIIRELNNLIMLSELPDNMNEKLQKWGYTKDMCITPQEVGAYLFNYDNGETMVNMIPIEVNKYGFEVKTIDDTISSLNKASEELYYSLKYGGDE